MQQVSQENKMGTMPVLRLIINMSLPAMFSMLVQSLYNVVDSIFVSWVSEEALTAVSLAFPVQTVLIAVGVGTGVGVSSLISRRLGAARQQEANDAASHGLVLEVLSSIIFILFGLFCARPFIQMFTQNATIVEHGTTYLSIVTILSVGSMVQICCEKIIQGTGNMIWPMIFQLTGAITNIILDPIMIFGYFGFPAMGVAGAAIATVAGQFVACGLSIYVLLKKDHEVKISLRGFRFKGATIREIYSVGAPSIVMQSIASVLTSCMNMILVGFSETAVSVLGVYYKLQSFVLMPLFGLTQGVMPIMGYNFGAGIKRRLMDALRWGMIIGLGIMVLGTLIFQFGAGWLLSIFNANENMLAMGIPALRTMSLCFIPATGGIIMSTFFQATGHGVYSLIISLIRQLVVILPVAYLLSLTGVLGNVWWAYPIAEAVALAMSIIMTMHLYRTQIKDLKLVREDLRAEL